MFCEICRIVKEKRPQTLLLENVKGLLNHDRGRTFITILNTLDELGYDVEWQVINGKYFVPQNRERVIIIGHLRGKPFTKVFPLRESDKIPDGTQSETQGKGEWVHLLYIRTIDSNYQKGSATRTMIKVKPIMFRNTNMNGRRIKSHNEPTFCLDTKETSGITVNEKIRRLTPLECERLMGFPDGWTEGISDAQRYKCLGNSIIPAMVKEIGKRL
jgi:DNA (cytosine-5)-methyltransferase 1